MPIFIWRPSSFAGPEKGATIPNRISLSETPRIETLLTSGVVEGSAAATIVLEDELVAGEPSACASCEPMLSKPSARLLIIDFATKSLDWTGKRNDSPGPLSGAVAC